MLVLFETSVGYAIFKVLNEKKLQEVDSLWKEFETPEKANKIVKLKHFEKFQDTAEALAAFTALMEGKINKQLKKVLKKIVKEAHEPLAVADAKLGGVIKDKLNLSCIHSPVVNELMRGIRSQMDGLIPGVEPREMSAMCLGLAHRSFVLLIIHESFKYLKCILCNCSLLNLAKHAASTVQILGAEKALFRALKSRRDTPKYGLIYHASLVGQTSPKHKGKISRMLAAKTVLAIRYDAFGEDSSSAMGVENRAKLEARLRTLEDRGVRTKFCLFQNSYLSGVNKL
uniref:Nop domain-containing protein n=1 Tax=Propithecus coquereli TaxID=379532 RepID=A0A2K6EJS4_PROCO